MKTNCHILSFFFSFSCKKIIGCLSHHYAPELSHFNSLYCLLFSSHDICAENLVRNRTNFHHLILSFLLIPSQPDGVQTILGEITSRSHSVVKAITLDTLER